jgi:glycosyltransferase involved in cell wall biosynthesis
VKVAVWHNLPSGGGKRALHDHVKGLIERGHTVECWCPPSADRTFLPLGELTVEHVLPLDSRPRKLRGPFARSLRDYYNVVDLLEAMDRHCQACAGAINQGKFDVLLAGACMYFRVTSIGRYVSGPTVIYLQEPYRWLYEAMPQLPWLARPRPATARWSLGEARYFLADLIKTQGLRVQAREELRNARAFDAILANSLYSRESILRAYGLDARVCYLGVDRQVFQNHGLPREDFVVGMGAFVPEKNVGFVIEALAHIPPPRPRLVWIGNVAFGPYVDDLTELARSLEVDFEPRVGIDEGELVDMFNRAAMLVYAPRLEPFGYAPLEANACGLPVVAVAEGGVRETVLDGVNGLVVEHDARAVAGAVQRLRQDAAYARQLGQAGCRRVAEHWSMSAAMDRLEVRLAEAVQSAARHGRRVDAI